VSPHARDVRAAIALAPDAVDRVEGISLDPRATAWAAAVTAAAIVMFWIARGLFDRGDVRRIVRAVCTTGFAVSVLAIAQAATAGRRIYWTFPTDHEGPLPFGPFVNRNHFATWAIMTAPLCFGYIAARSDRHAGGPGASRARIVRFVDGRSLWLLACGAALVGALLLSLSRSGILALGAAGAVTMVLSRGRADTARYWWFVAAAGAAVATAALWADVGAIADRLAAASTAVEGRLRIWRETLPVVRDFWLTGTGAGTYQTAMLLYQQSDRLWYFNQAHNQYLQLAAEGGLLLTAPAVIALAAYARQARCCAREDRSGMFWIRAGALCGLGAAALQSIWETGLTMPANAALAAVLAALAVHHRPDDGRR
jgi:O-antigen ligase